MTARRPAGGGALLLGALAAGALALIWFAAAPEPQPAGIEPSLARPAVPPAAEQATAPPAGAQPEPEIPAAAAERAPDDSGAGVSIGGWIGDASGAALDGIVIEIESLGFDGEEIAAFTTRSDPRGEFVFDAIVPERQYRLEIEPQRDYAGFSIDSFSTADADALRRIQLERISLVDVDGMIVDTNLAPVANFELSVRSLAVEFPDRSIRSDASGYFQLRQFPAGELRIATSASDYYRIKGLELRPDEYRNLTLIIDRGSYHLSGLVSDANGAPVAEAQVTLKSAFATDSYHSFSYRSTVTDASGAFEFAALGGNRLTLGIYANGFESRILGHEFISFSDSLSIRLEPQAE